MKKRFSACALFSVALTAHATALGDHVANAGLPLAGAPWVARSVTAASSPTSTNVTVKTYVNAAGVVFAVSWQGPVKPDLQALLGPYFAAYAAHPTISGMASVRSGDLVVYSTGFMRHFTGYAYLKSQTPAGFHFP